jgi:hypothetical protein
LRRVEVEEHGPDQDRQDEPGQHGVRGPAEVDREVADHGVDRAEQVGHDVARPDAVAQVVPSPQGDDTDQAL